MPDQAGFSRRAFLVRAGVVGAVLGTGGVLVSLPVWATSPPNPLLPSGGTTLESLVALLRPALEALALDAMSGLAVFSLPGADAYSAAQGTPDTRPGAIQAKGPQFLMNALDHFVPFPDELAKPLAAAFSSAVASLNLPLPDPLGLLPSQLVDNVDSALSFLLDNDQTIPLSVAVALLLNLLATQVSPATAVAPGSAMGPFARLTYAEKAQAFSILEDPESNLVADLDMQLPQPLHDSVSGLLKFLGGSLLEFASFGNLGDFGFFNTSTRQLTSEPVGWTLSGYQPNGVGDGWDELKGYYQGRTSVQDI
jgi:hypothetical protein